MTVILEVIGPTPQTPVTPTPTPDPVTAVAGIDGFTLSRLLARRPQSIHDKCASNAGLS
jgi:hypothetical protein